MGKVQNCVSVQEVERTINKGIFGCLGGIVYANVAQTCKVHLA
jgi:hypothetical protein